MLDTTPVMKMAGVFIIVITRSIMPLCFLYHLLYLLGIYRNYCTRFLIIADPSKHSGYFGGLISCVMSFIVYVLYSDIAEKHYTGFTENLIERLKSHNELVDDWTARYRPWRLIFRKEFEMKLDAMHYEKWFKGGRGAHSLQHYHTRDCRYMRGIDPLGHILDKNIGDLY